MIVSWWSYSTPLWYAQLIEGRRPDIFIADDRTRLDLNLGDLTTVIDGNLGVRPVYAIRIDQNEMRLLRERYNVTPLASPRAGNVFRITPASLGGRRGSDSMTERVGRLSYFFPAHNEEANVRGLVEEALETLPSLAEAFEIIVVNDGSRDATGAIADELAAAHPDVGPRRPPPDEPRLRGRAAVGLPRRAPRARRVHRRRPPVPRRGPRPADRAARPRPTRRTSWSATGSSAPTRSSGPSTRSVYRFANRVWFGLRVRDVDCACKLFRREALAGIAVESGGAFFSAELLIKLRVGRPDGRRGRRAAPSPDGRLTDRREAERDLPGRARLLAAPPADVVEPDTCPPPRHAGDRAQHCVALTARSVAGRSAITHPKVRERGATRRTHRRPAATASLG